MDCPNCPQAPLEEKEFSEGLLFDFCPECGGAWLDPGELERLGAGVDGFARALTEALSGMTATNTPCPGCSSKMGRVRIEKAGTELRSCPKCRGTWIDAKQLRSLRSYLEYEAKPEASPPEPEPFPAEPPQPWPNLPPLSDTAKFVITRVVMGCIIVAMYFQILRIVSKASPGFPDFETPPAPTAERPKPPAAPAPAPASAVPEPRPQQGLSEADVQLMVQSAVKSALKEPRKNPRKRAVEFHSAVDDPSYENAPSDGRAAVVVGIEKYSDMPEAEYAVRDAVAVREHLLALGYPPRNVLLLTDGEATKGRLTAALNSWLPQHVEAGATVFLYYSGHGAPDAASKQAYLVPIDGQPEDLPDTALPLKQVYAALGALKAKRVIVALDSCFSGLGGRSVLAKGTRPLMTQIKPGAGGGEKIVVLSASGPAQISGTIDEEEHGAFTYYFLKGLNGEAKDAQGRVTVSSLYQYVKPRVEDAARLQKRDQSPQLTSAGDAADVLR